MVVSHLRTAATQPICMNINSNDMNKSCNLDSVNFVVSLFRVTKGSFTSYNHKHLVYSEGKSQTWLLHHFYATPLLYFGNMQSSNKQEELTYF